MTNANIVFKRPLSRNALHIDYLRLLCGREKAFNNEIKQHRVGAQIAFSEWDVVLFIPVDELYADNLISIYANPDITKHIAGSSGYFSYVWDHPINEKWEARLRERPGPTNGDSHISMLLSLRFTDRFRSRLGVGAELLFCDFLQSTLEADEFRGVSAVVAHGVGWNDTTVVLRAESNQEACLVDILTTIRYCSEARCLGQKPGPKDPLIVAATYSHILGDLELYTDENLSFGTLTEKVRRARLLVRVNPAHEPVFRTVLRDMFTTEDDGQIGTELGHYNFSADVTTAFKREGPDAVKIVQGFRRKIETFMSEHEIEPTTFSETTTEITLEENEDAIAARTKDAAPSEGFLKGDYLAEITRIQRQIAPDPSQEYRGPDISNMTRHRLAILLQTIATNLEDPVRGSVMGHICRFISVKFESLLEESDRTGQEDLCHILEYALLQATDGLSQFQHDANSLGLSGRGGYSRLVQAVEQYLNELLATFDLNLWPLLTFGLRPSHKGAIVDYWIDIPFNIAFMPQRWFVLYHELAHMCWSHMFGWRLDAFGVWNEIHRASIEISAATIELPTAEDDAGEGESGRAKSHEHAHGLIDEIFPNYLMFNVVADRSLDKLAELMITRDLISRQQSVLIKNLWLRMVFHVLLELFDRRRKPVEDIEKFRRASSRSAVSAAECQEIAFQWWDRWRDLWQENKDGTLNGELTASLTNAARTLRDAIFRLKDQKVLERNDAAHVENVVTLISDAVFQDEARGAALMAIRLLKTIGGELKERQPENFEGPDPSAVEFGYVLAKIDSMRATAKDVADKQIRGYAAAIRRGYVFASGAGETALSRLLAADELRDIGDRRERSTLMVSLSTTLSLWHIAATESFHAEVESSAEELLEQLQHLGIAEVYSFEP